MLIGAGGGRRSPLTRWLAAGRPASRSSTTSSSTGHHLAVWQKKPPQAARAIMVLLHGRTWSSLPNFDLQVPGEKRSFMDALADAGLEVYARRPARLRRDAARCDRVADAGSRGRRRARGRRRGSSSARRPLRGVPIYLFGLSRGAMVAAMVAQQQPETLAGVVLLGFGFDPDVSVPRTDAAGASAAAAQHRRRTPASDFITREPYTGATLTAFVQGRAAARSGAGRLARRTPVQCLPPRADAGAGAADPRRSRSAGAAARWRPSCSRGSAPPTRRG